MTKSTITRERIKQYAHDPHMCNVNEEIRELACMALAALDSEPVAGEARFKEEHPRWTPCTAEHVSMVLANPEDWPNYEVRYLYAAPQPAPELTATVERLNASGYEYEGGEVTPQNVAAVVDILLQQLDDAVQSRDAQPALERDNVRREHAEWSQATFGNVGPIGPLKHLSKEALEAAAEPGDLSEWADMQFLLWDAQRRAGITDEQITQALIEKLAVNKQREWPAPKDGEPRLHIKELPAPECQHQWRHGGANKLQNQKQCIKCGRVELDAQPEPVVPDDVQRDAKRWRALLGSARIRILGSAGFDATAHPGENPDYRHFGMEIWTHYPNWLHEKNEYGIDTLTQYADAMLAAAPQEVKSES